MRTDLPDRHDAEIRRHSGWLLPIAAIVAIGILCTLFLLYYLAPAPGSLIDEHVVPSARTTPVHLEIGRLQLVVPANFLPYASERIGGRRRQALIYAELPDFRGYSDSQATAFDESGAASPIVRILIKQEEFDVSETARLSRIYLNEVIDRRGSGGPFGLVEYAFRYDSGYRGETLFVGRNGDGEIVMRCTQSGPEVPSANCLRELQLAPDVSLSYRFKRSHLARWLEISRGVDRLVTAFRVAGR